MREISSEKTLSNWTFGRYVDRHGQQALLGIFYSINGEIAKRPLVAPMSDADSPAKVRRALLDAGADVEYLGATQKQQVEELSIRLSGDNLASGVYARKLGWSSGRYMTVKGLRMSDRTVIVESSILEIAAQHFGKSGRQLDWEVEVAALVQKSSYATFAILLALAAPLQHRVAEGEEGFIVNLAGDSSIGKTAALMAGQSIAGPGSALLSWDTTSRALIERAAAMSDAFMPIDDLDKMSSKPGYGRRFTELTHMLTSGSSKAYSAFVKDKLPDLKWSCVAMTGGRITVEEMTGQRRENHERVRCMDLVVPPAADGGIWDRRADTDVPSQLTDSLKAAAIRAYGRVLPKWILSIEQDGNIERVRELRDEWVESTGIADTDGIGHRVAKKFGLCRAAGLLAVELKLLPWSAAFVEEVVFELHENARRTLYPFDAPMNAGLRKALKAGLRARREPLPTGETPTIGDAPTAQNFVREGRTKEWYLTRKCFDSFFETAESSEWALRRLEEAGGVTKDRNGKRGKQVRVLMAGDEKRVRFLKIHGPTLQAVVGNAGALHKNA